MGCGQIGPGYPSVRFWISSGPYLDHQMQATATDNLLLGALEHHFFCFFPDVGKNNRKIDPNIFQRGGPPTSRKLEGLVS